MVISEWNTLAGSGGRGALYALSHVFFAPGMRNVFVGTASLFQPSVADSQPVTAPRGIKLGRRLVVSTLGHRSITTTPQMMHLVTVCCQCNVSASAPNQPFWCRVSWQGRFVNKSIFSHVGLASYGRL